jgi:lipoyl(octanoyl) transferase
VIAAMEWDLHSDAPRTAAHNMAKDAWCLERSRRTGRPALRLYAWERLTLSVGRSQRIGREIDVAACRAAGVPLVRRITGGRAVLHGSDLTYAVTAPTALPGFGGGIMAIYRSLSRVFVRFLSDLGCAPEVKAYTGRERLELASPICFSTPSAFEILVGGRKLVGSAQRLLADAFLQHGSLPLAPQWELLSRLFRGADAAALREQMTDLESLGVLPAHGEPELRERLAAAFAAELGVRLVPAAWDEADEAGVRGLEAAYGPADAEPPVALTGAAGMAGV